MKNNKTTIIILFLSILLASFSFNSPTAKPQEDDKTVFKVGWQSLGGISALDPVLFLGTYNDLTILEQTVEGLFRYDFFQHKYVPELATGIEITNQTSAKYYLRQNVTFHDGTPFNASAVKWNFERCNNITFPTDAPYHDVYYKPADKFRNYSTAEWNLDWVPMGEDVAIVNKTIIIDEFTIQINFNLPSNFYFTKRKWGFISPTFYAGNETQGVEGHENLVATGPFKYILYDPFDNIVRFEKYEKYWNVSAPRVDELILVFFPTVQIGEAALFSGEIDMLIGLGEFDYEAIEADPDLEIMQYEEYPHMGHQHMLIMSLNVYPLGIRKAMSFAYDYDLLINSALGGYPIRGGGVIPRPLNYYNSSIDIPYRNLSIARQIMIDEGFAPPEASGWTDEEWEFKADNEPLYIFDLIWQEQDKDIRDVLEQSAREIGIQLNDTQVTPDEWVQLIFVQYEVRNSPAWVLVTYGIGGGPDPWGALLTLYESTQFLNTANITDPEIDNWIWQSFVLNDTSDPSKQELANLVVDKIQNEIYPKLWLFHPQMVAGRNKKWGGFTRIRFYYFADIHLKPEVPVEFLIPGIPLRVLGFVTGMSVLILIGKNYKRIKIKSFIK
jgi:ABC-type transport system substrate-binding protein